MKKDIRNLVSSYVRKYGTRDPFELAEFLNIQVQIGNLGSCSGCYMFLKNHRCIFLNGNLDKSERTVVMAHELGHAIMHRKENCYFIRNKTFLLTSKNEIEANKFAAELLIPDSLVEENRSFTIRQFSRLLGYQERLVELKLN